MAEPVTATPAAETSVAAPAAPVAAPATVGTPGSAAENDGSDVLRDQIAQRLREDGLVEETPESTETPAQTPDTTPAETPAAVEAAVVSEAERLLEESGVKAKRSDGRDNWIPYSKTVKIIENAKKKWADELGATHKAELDKREADLKGHTEWRTQAEQRMTQMDAVGYIMKNDPKQFSKMLEQINPEYKNLFAAVAAAAAPAAPAKPAPDVKYQDGSVGYSPEQYDKLMQWQHDRAVEAAETRINERFAKEEKARKEEQQKREMSEAREKRVNEQMEDAYTWDGFKENEKEIVEALAANQNLTLEGAYRRVVMPKYKANRDNMRSEVIEDINKVPKSVGGSPAIVKPAPVNNDEVPLRDQIRAKLKKDGLV